MKTKNPSNASRKRPRSHTSKLTLEHVERALMGASEGVVDELRSFQVQGFDLSAYRSAHKDRTLLMMASRTNSVACCRFLLGLSPPLDARDRSGNTALHLAAYHGSQDVVQLLLAAGADRTLLNCRGEDAAAAGAAGGHMFETAALEALRRRALEAQSTGEREELWDAVARGVSEAGMIADCPQKSVVAASLPLRSLYFSVEYPSETGGIVTVCSSSSSRFLIGRSRRCNLRLSDGTVSKLHATAYFDSDLDSYVVEDAGSKHGTFLNGRRLSSAPGERSDPFVLRLGDRLVIGANAAELHVVRPGPTPTVVASNFAPSLEYLRAAELSLQRALQRAQQLAQSGGAGEQANASLRQKLLGDEEPTQLAPLKVDRAALRREACKRKYGRDGGEEPPELAPAVQASRAMKLAAASRSMRAKGTKGEALLRKCGRYIRFTGSIKGVVHSMHTNHLAQIPI